MDLPLADVNLLAVVAATVAAMAIGFIWYHPAVFGTKWMQLKGITKQAVDQNAMTKSILTGLAATFITNYFFAVILLLVGTVTIHEALVTGFVIWLATALPLELHGVAWDMHPPKLMVLNVTNWLVTFLVEVAIIQSISM